MDERDHFLIVTYRRREQQEKREVWRAAAVELKQRMGKSSLLKGQQTKVQPH